MAVCLNSVPVPGPVPGRHLFGSSAPSTLLASAPLHFRTRRRTAGRTGGKEIPVSTLSVLLGQENQAGALVWHKASALEQDNQGAHWAAH